MNRTLTLNCVEINVIVQALRTHANWTGAHGAGKDINTREEIYFIEGLRALIDGLKHDAVEHELWCPHCQWHGNTSETHCTCGAELYVTRGGVRVTSIRPSPASTASVTRAHLPSP